MRSGSGWRGKPRCGCSAADSDSGVGKKARAGLSPPSKTWVKLVPPSLPCASRSLHCCTDGLCHQWVGVAGAGPSPLCFLFVFWLLLFFFWVMKKEG